MSKQSKLFSYIQIKKRRRSEEPLVQSSVENENNNSQLILNESETCNAIVSPSIPSCSTVSGQPQPEDKNVGRKFKYQKQWEDKYEWLYFDRTRGGAFCKLCEKHLKNDVEVFQKTSGVFISVPFTNFRKATGSTGKLEKHSKSDKHCKSVFMENERLQNLNAPIHTQIIQYSEDERDKNRQALSSLIRSVYFLAKEEIPHTTKYEPLVQRILMRENETLRDWVKSQSERSTYISKSTASEILSSIGTILDKADDKILNGKYYSIMGDESTNINNQSELSVMVRHVVHDPVCEVRERFLCIIYLERTDAESIFLAIDDALKKKKYVI